MSQQDIERYYFEKFRRAYPLPPGAVTYSDRPDVRIAGAQIGIEITHFYVTPGTSPASEQGQSNLREIAVAEGQKLFTTNGGANVALTFSFDKTQPIQDVRALARKLADLGKRIEHDGNGQVRKNIFADIPELEFVYLYARELQHDDELDPEFPNGAPDLSEGFRIWADYRNRREVRARQTGIYKPLAFPARWNVVQSHSFGLMSITRLNEIISEKEKKAQRYAQCDAYWLLIVVDFIDPAQEQEIRIDGLTVRSNMFRRIIIYKPGFEQIIELEPQKREADTADSLM
ncbi:MAG TPA: hypothetical protein VLY24_06350 [Bryobacteraceae bacterium]|nr:hypothetical protein [Bryobacteraceae bacterium]